MYHVFSNGLALKTAEPITDKATAVALFLASVEMLRDRPRSIVAIRRQGAKRRIRVWVN
jgi:hypothetical protein